MITSAVELGEDGEKRARVNAYTAGVFMSKTTKARETLQWLDKVVEHLSRVSGVQLSAGVLGRTQPTDQCAPARERNTRSPAPHTCPPASNAQVRKAGT